MAQPADAAGQAGLTQERLNGPLAGQKPAGRRASNVPAGHRPQAGLFNNEPTSRPSLMHHRSGTRPASLQLLTPPPTSAAQQAPPPHHLPAAAALLRQAEPPPPRCTVPAGSQGGRDGSCRWAVAVGCGQAVAPLVRAMPLWPGRPWHRGKASKNVKQSGHTCRLTRAWCRGAATPARKAPAGRRRPPAAAPTRAGPAGMGVRLRLQPRLRQAAGT